MNCDAPLVTKFCVRDVPCTVNATRTTPCGEPTAVRATQLELRQGTVPIIAQMVVRTPSRTPSASSMSELATVSAGRKRTGVSPEPTIIIPFSKHFSSTRRVSACRDVEGTEETEPARVRGLPRVFCKACRDRRGDERRPGPHFRPVSPRDDFEDTAAAHHVDQVTPPRSIEPRRHREDMVLHLFDTRPTQVPPICIFLPKAIAWA